MSTISARCLPPDSARCATALAYRHFGLAPPSTGAAADLFAPE